LGQVADPQRRTTRLLRRPGARNHRSQHHVAEADCRRPAPCRRAIGGGLSMDEIDAGVEHATPIWAVFGDLMSGLLGAFVLILVGVLGVQLELVSSLEAEIQKRQQEEQRRQALEQALAGPLAAGRVTLNNGRIGISGSVLFALNSDQLQPEGRQLLKGLAPPIAAYLAASE